MPRLGLGVEWRWGAHTRARASAPRVEASGDHTDDRAVAEVFQRIQDTAGRLDILVNVVWGGYERMVEDGRFTWAAPFWEQPMWRWEAMVTAGARATYVASQHAARTMAQARRGLIVHISSWAAQKHIGSTLYGVSKSATDKMASDMAHVAWRDRRLALSRFGAHGSSPRGGCI